MPYDHVELEAVNSPRHSNSVIVEEAIESSVSNIDMTKSKDSLKKPLTQAIKSRKDPSNVIEEESTNIPLSTIALRHNAGDKDS